MLINFEQGTCPMRCDSPTAEPLEFMTERVSFNGYTATYKRGDMKQIIEFGNAMIQALNTAKLAILERHLSEWIFEDGEWKWVLAQNKQDFLQYHKFFE